MPRRPYRLKHTREENQSVAKRSICSVKVILGTFDIKQNRLKEELNININIDYHICSLKRSFQQLDDIFFFSPFSLQSFKDSFLALLFKFLPEKCWLYLYFRKPEKNYQKQKKVLSVRTQDISQ